MKRLRLVGLGGALAISGGRPAWIRLGLMAAGFTVGAALLLGALSLVPASRTHDVRQYGRAGTLLERPKDRHEPNTLLAWPTTQRYGDLQIGVWALQAQGDAPVPRGLERVPAAGQVIASPALADVMRGLAGPDLERRFRGRLSGVIGSAGLVSPDELFAYVGKPAGLHVTPKSALVIGSFDDSGQPSQPLDHTALLMIAVLTSALLLPIWLFVSTVTRLSAATREARLAAVRLAGGTQSQVRFLAGIEPGLAALAGTLLGIPTFLAGRPLVANGLILGKRFFPQDFTPPIAGTVAVVLGLPMLAVVITLVTMRSLVVSPLGIARRHPKRHARSAWPFVLLSGVGLLAWAASQHAGIMRRGELEAELIVGSALILAALGLAGTAVWLAWLLARRIATRTSSVSALLGMRRLEADPSAAGRVVGGVAVLIALVGVIHAGLLSERPDGPTSQLASWAMKLDPETVIAVPFEVGNEARMTSLRKVSGVTSLHLTGRVPSGGTRFPFTTTAIIRTDGRPETLEALRRELGWVASVDTVQQLRQDYHSVAVTEANQIGGLVTGITMFLLLVSGITFLVATVDWIMERRRTLAVLSAVGISGGVIRRSILAQVGLPLATSVVLGVGGALAVIALLFTAAETKIEFPISQLAVPTAAVIAMVLFVTAAATPWLRVARRPDLLRNE